MFKKKNPVKKLEVKHEDMGEREIKINLRPLVAIEQHESRINGKVQAPTYRISIAERDVMTLSAREYNELFMEMLRHKDADEIIHSIAESHMQEHHSHAAEETDFLAHIGAMLEKVEFGEKLNGKK